MTNRVEANSDTANERNTSEQMEELSHTIAAMPDARLAKVMQMRQAIRQDDYVRDRVLDLTIDRLGPDLGIH